MTTIRQLLIAGGGIGGLAAALAGARAGWQVRVFEQAQAFAEIGAGVQLGPNATRLLADFGLTGALERAAAFPGALVVRGALDGAEIARMRLGAAMRERYGAPYATIHRADLHALLLDAVRGQDALSLQTGSRIDAVQPCAQAVTLTCASGKEVEGDALIGADGLWSAVRSRVWADGTASPTGHLAWRALLPQARLPAALRSTQVDVWLGPRLHAVAYPVRGGEALNLVVIVHGTAAGDEADWSRQSPVADLHAAMGATCAPLQNLVRAATGWRLWALHDRAPVAGPEAMARGRVALLGDAAHPMPPYLAQGAGMAIEDAAELGVVLRRVDGEVFDVPLALRRYALNRWQRNARVQARARRNGRIFHAQGLVRWGRDASLRLLGERLLDMPWLYGA